MLVTRALCLLISLATSNACFSTMSEYVPSIEIANYQSELAYLINADTVPTVVVGKNYQNACKHLAIYGFEWKTIPTTDTNPGCYSPTDRKIMGADTWYCADGSLAYYNIPWFSCNAFKVCPNAYWTLLSDGITCMKPTTTCTVKPKNVPEVKLISALAYAEASPNNSTYEEKAAIANALVRKSKAYGFSTVNEFVANKPKQLSSLNDNNIRLREVLCSDLSVDYPDLEELALNALDPEGIDYANGGCFWDGVDLRTSGADHLHYPWGYYFTNPAHDVVRAGDSPPMDGVHPGYSYTFESTAGYGHTVIWKYTEDFMTTEGAHQCR